MDRGERGGEVLDPKVEKRTSRLSVVVRKRPMNKREAGVGEGPEGAGRRGGGG